MIDNFNEIRRWIIENHAASMNETAYYVVTVRKRRKDIGNEDMVRGEQTIKTYFITSEADLMAKREEMIKLADEFNARIYINVNPKPAKAVNYNLQKEYARLMFEGINKNPLSVAEGVVFNTDTPRHLQSLMFDVDMPSLPAFGGINKSVDTIIGDLEDILDDSKFRNTIADGKLRADGPVNYIIIDSVSGKHIIAKPFNRKLFNERIEIVTCYKFNKEANPADIEYYHWEGDEAFGIKENANVLLYFNNK